jgi:uncharacterized RmlC-like cupin family protein
MLNVNVIASGQIAHVPIFVPDQPNAESYQISVANLIAVNASGSAIDITTPSPVTLVVGRRPRPRLQWEMHR